MAGALMASSDPRAQELQPIPRPAPENGFRLEKSRMVPMRDGVRLSTDLYFPEVEDEQLPVVLIRTPYDKNRMRDDAEGDAHMFASHGFVVATQDSRGKFESEGIYSPPAGHEAEDGYDTVDWIASQPWSNGRVGMHGCSYPAEVQAATAPLKHPNLTTMVPRNGPMIGAANGRYRYWSGFKGGVLDFAAAFPWYFETGVKYSFKPPPGLSDEVIDRIREFYDPTPSRLPQPDWEQLVWTLPLVDIMNKAGSLPNDFLELVTRDFGDPWWHDVMGYYDGTETISVPSLHVSSWYDISVDETIFESRYFRENATTEAAANGQFLILAPSTHCAYEQATERTLVGDRDIGDARLDFYSIYLDWFDYWLKGIDNGVMDGPKVRYYTMGRNEWRSADQWPLPEVQYTNYYLRSGGDANSRHGDAVGFPPNRRRTNLPTPSSTTPGTRCRPRAVHAALSGAPRPGPSTRDGSRYARTCWSTRHRPWRAASNSPAPSRRSSTFRHRPGTRTSPSSSWTCTPTEPPTTSRVRSCAPATGKGSPTRYGWRKAAFTNCASTWMPRAITSSLGTASGSRYPAATSRSTSAT